MLENHITSLNLDNKAKGEHIINLIVFYKELVNKYRNILNKNYKKLDFVEELQNDIQQVKDKYYFSKN